MLLRVSNAAPGLHTTARELQTYTFDGSDASNTTKIQREDPQEKEERMNIVAGEGKKSEFLGGPAEGGLAEGGPAESKPTTTATPTLPEMEGGSRNMCA